MFSIQARCRARPVPSRALCPNVAANFKKKANSATVPYGPETFGNIAMSLAESHADCYLTFQELCEAAQGLEGCHFYVLDEFDRYKLWAGNVGAAHSKNTYMLSLDYRLREASFYKDLVLHIFFSTRRQDTQCSKAIPMAFLVFFRHIWCGD